jgi:hypothetical protein
MARASATNVDPAADAAALLRRVGFATLLLLTPTAALVARRGMVVLVPIAIALLLIAAALDGAHRPIGATLRRLARSRAGLAAGVVLLWCALSLVWTPFLAPAAERLLNIVTTVALSIAGYLALPERMRSANLYLLPVGVGIAAVAAIALILFGAGAQRGPDEASQNIDRGLTVLALLVWPAISWLRSRGRHFESFAVAMVVGVAVVLGPQPMPLIAMGVGGAAFALVVWAHRVGVLIAASAMAGLLALAPLVPFIVRPLGGLVFQSTDPTWRSLAIWRAIIRNEPVRLITGHGLETSLRDRLAGFIPPNAPTTLLFEAWYELGVVGALAGAVALFGAAMAASRNNPSLVPGMIAAFATAFAFACLGIGTAQMWWFTALAVVVLVFVAIERGQFRTSRPKAPLLRPVNDR